MPGGYIGFGGYLEAEINRVWTRIPYAKDFKGGAPAVDEIDDDNYDNTEAVKDTIAGFTDYGDATFMVNYDPANAVHSWLWESVGDMTQEVSWRWHYPNTATSVEEFTAWVKGMDGNNPVKEKIERTVTLRVTCKPTIT